jgi:outer membrane lipoprotein-sorting protein
MRWAAGLLVLLGLALAQNPRAILNEVQQRLNQSPWESLVQGEIRFPGQGLQTTVFLLRVIPGQKPFIRLDFQKPGSLEGNFLLVTPKEVWNYLYLTNQVVIQPLARGSFQGLSLNPALFSNFQNLAQQIELRLDGSIQTSQGPAWRIVGTNANPSLGFAHLIVLILERSLQPFSITFTDSSGKVLLDLHFTHFQRADLTPSLLERYPPDAQVLHR